MLSSARSLLHFLSPLGQNSQILRNSRNSPSLLLSRCPCPDTVLASVSFSATSAMSTIAEYVMATEVSEPSAAESAPKVAAASQPDNSEVATAESSEPASRVPKSYYKFGKGQPKWENRSRSGVETDHQKRKLKKVAILMGYSGQGYAGMQWNPAVETIESVLFDAMAKADLIPKNWVEDIQQLGFQRCARTDKGVSAAGQVISIPLPVEAEVSNTVVEKVNAHLPPAIRLFGLKKVTRGFNSKNWCSARTYLYMMPTFTLAPLEEVVTYDYRLPEERLNEANALLARFLGSNNFHNFTVGVKPWQDAAKRFMKEVKAGKPFVRDGIEFIIITVKGQSFMMHQIRKMVGLVVAIMRGHVGPEIFDTIYGPQKADVPRAPGLGLLLQAVHFDMYNDKFGNDGIHDELVWPECDLAVEQFKEEFIYPVMVKGEKEDKNMLEWLSHLPNHIFGFREHEEVRGQTKGTHSELGKALHTIDRVREEALSGEEGGGDDSEDAKPAKKKKRFEVL